MQRGQSIDVNFYTIIKRRVSKTDRDSQEKSNNKGWTKKRMKLKTRYAQSLRDQNQNLEQAQTPKAFTDESKSEVASEKRSSDWQILIRVAKT